MGLVVLLGRDLDREMYELDDTYVTKIVVIDKS